MDSYRCLDGNLPRAQVGVFIKHQDGSLLFVDWDQDDKRPPNESGYLSTHYGDSGSPVFTTTKDEQGKERTVMIAIQQGTHNPPENTRYKDGVLDKCRMIESKVSRDVVEWLGNIFDYEKACEKKNGGCPKEPNSA